jgi:HSP20 family molecular chaperone IbpA
MRVCRYFQKLKLVNKKTFSIATISDWNLIYSRIGLKCYETADEYHLEADFPSCISKNDLKLTLNNGQIVLDFSKTLLDISKVNTELEDIVATQFFGNAVQGRKIFGLPSDAETTFIKARFCDGILDIYMPRFVKGVDGEKLIPIERG